MPESQRTRGRTRRRRTSRSSPSRSTWIAPQLARLVAAAPVGDDWVHEVKYDGYRVIAVVDGGAVRLLTRNRKDWTARFPSVEAALSGAGLRGTVLDGEIAAELAGGRTSFEALPGLLASSSTSGLKYFVFDMLRHDGQDIRGLPLVERKARLEAALRGHDGSLAYSEHRTGGGPSVLDEACRAGLEGIISKRAAAPYRSGRGSDWLKVKCVLEQEFVIGGYTDPRGSRSGFGALHVGTFEKGRLVYRGKVGTGFSDQVLEALRRRLDRIGRKTSPFGEVPRSISRSAHWVRPVLVAQIRYTEVTAEGRLRHPSFMGLREDKDASDVRLERTGGDGGP